MLGFLEKVIISINDLLWNKHILVVMLLFTGVYFTIKTRFLPFRKFKEMIRVITEKNTITDDGESISSFQAFCVSTASRVGAGNLAGVVAAISIGGPGSIFWMWIVALVGASSAFIESTLAQIYKERDPVTGGYRGGPAYFMKKALNKRWMGVLFAISGLICWAGVSQVMSNTMTESLYNIFKIDKLLIISVLTVLGAIIIFGKKDKIAKVLEKLVPIMATLYLVVVIFIILKNITLIPSVILEIVENAFGIKQAVSGGIGAVVMQGVKRGLFSNEAGSGSAPCAAAAANVSHPVKQGLIQSLGVFVDTLLICSATAFVMLLADKSVTKGLVGIELLQKATEYHIGSIGQYFIALILLLFCFSTFLGILYYAKPNIAFLYDKKIGLEIYKVFALVMFFLGGLSKYNFVWALADFGLGLMTIINLCAIIPLSKIAIESLKDYEMNYEDKKKI
ncbi:sodium:alanine symporter family protein [Gottschalkia acidurici 9a]|uniref:Sodium:alanine symporter family protein n=1 Tax=Gottschalkia acidurici (strain ATCC 7906 / DSM 604 / BCRC 14475 / CIP 104303 / KCTC 5404 / NCIMB 10678 / 9a) TaxID=1128398 RepID=K0B471_GOTA9|nr:alanine/glycine:cation symporter family protein [Gottschalkia acidurici]AFS79351.1 sodium:alanine symporter family protein [Gottschalkia acidurici 9a]